MKMQCVLCTTYADKFLDCKKCCKFNVMEILHFMTEFFEWLHLHTIMQQNVVYTEQKHFLLLNALVFHIRYIE